MAVYVTSDAHGHLRALDEALSAAGVGEHDVLYVLGDMIDRGPEPLGVVNLVRSLPGAQVLMGNHEQLMLEALAHREPPREGGFDLSGFTRASFVAWSDWVNNGGATTVAALEALEPTAYEDVLAWMRELPVYAAVQAGEHTFALTHAGVRASSMRSWAAGHGAPDLCDPIQLEQALAAQAPEDLLWIREDFWCERTGLVSDEGAGPIVVAGHTPSPYLAHFLPAAAELCMTAEGKGRVVGLGGDAGITLPVDRINIDCAAAAGSSVGRVGVLRLDDGAFWYADIEDGE